MPTQPDTPRTDAVSEPLTEWRKLPKLSNLPLVNADFARQLERETIAQAEEIRRLREGLAIAAASIEGAIGVSPLWLISECSAEHHHEAEALSNMSVSLNHASALISALLNPPTKEN